MLASFVGSTTHITVTNGQIFTGLFSSASFPKDASEPKQYVLKYTQQLDSDSSEDYIGEGEDYTLVFDVKDVVDVHTPNVSTEKIQAKLTNGMLIVDD